MIEAAKIYAYCLHCMDCQSTFYLIITGTLHEIKGHLVVKDGKNKGSRFHIKKCPMCQSNKLYLWETL